MDPQQQFCLKWNSFGSNLASAFSNLFKSESLADVTLFCEGVTFKAHKLILAACSKHFQDLFETAPPSPSGVLVILDGTSSANMSALLEFMYKGEVHVSQESLSSFLKAAECLQVKGLSIEHEKLAVVQGGVPPPSPADAPLESPPGSRKPNAASNAASNKNGGKEEELHALALANYSMQPPHYRPAPYEQRVPPSVAQQPSQQQQQQQQHYEAACVPRKRQHRSASDQAMQDSAAAAAVRASVLRDGSKGGVPGGGGAGGGGFRPAKAEAPGYDSAPAAVEAGPAFEARPNDDASSNASMDGGRRPSLDPGPTCPEDLRVKMEFGGGRPGPGEDSAGGGGPGFPEPLLDKMPDMPATPNWGASPKGPKGSPLTPGDGKKLKCPFCERLYGYETNLRAHIRQRHQGIRVHCPFCARTFTRNNTVRRHIAREHKTEYSVKSFTQAQVHNHNQ